LSPIRIIIFIYIYFDLSCNSLYAIPEISPHAITGVQTLQTTRIKGVIPKTPQTMRVKGVIQKTPVMMLADTGSTYNLLSIELAARLGIQPDENSKLKVKLANGKILSSKGKCQNVHVYLGGTLFVLEFDLIDLIGYDSLLGNQWLRTLGPILWDFSLLRMTFQWQGHEVTLQGTAFTKNKFIERPQMGVQSPKMFHVQTWTRNGPLYLCERFIRFLLAWCKKGQ
jgi:hypothetical protein